MRRPTTRSVVLCNRMLQTLFGLQLHGIHIKKVRFIISRFSFLPSKCQLFSTSVEEPQPKGLLSISTHQTNRNHLDLSSIDFRGIAQSVVSRCSHILEKKDETFTNPSLKDFLLKLSCISPEIVRRFWRVSKLNPRDVLDLLLGFESETGRTDVEKKKVESLWGIFKWVSEQSRHLEHLPQCCKVMASMLVRVGFFRDTEFLLTRMGSRGLLLDCQEIFCKLIKGNINAGELGRATLIYDQMRGLGVVPTSSCYHVLIKSLVGTSETDLAYKVCMDMVETDLGICEKERSSYESVIRLLCTDGKIQEARNLVKKATACGMEPSVSVIGAISSGYCKKKDYDDLLSLFAQVKCIPDVATGNKIVSSLCDNFGVERANLLVQELEQLGYCSNEITFGILIGRCCREGKIKNAFMYLSEVLSRCLIPHICSYNALLSAFFKENMCKHVPDILHEMDDSGIAPNLFTFRVLLAGYCKAKQFDKVKTMVGKMVDRGLIELSKLEDPLSKAFLVLGLNPLSVKVRRDNNIGSFRTEFFDELGNGLYLETDEDKYDKTMTAILDESMFPDFNAHIAKVVGRGHVKTAMMMVDEMAQWGQELSLSTFSTLLKGICGSHGNTKVIVNLLDKMPKLTAQLDETTLDLLIKALCRRGLTYKASLIFQESYRRGLKIRNGTYTALLMGLCRKGNLRTFGNCWELAQRNQWIPDVKECNALFQSLIEQQMVSRALEVFETMLMAYPHLRLDICHVFLEKICGMEFTNIADVLVEELTNRGCILDCMSYSHLILGFCKKKQFSKAFLILDTMLGMNLVPCFDVSVHLISQMCKAGNFEKANALKEMVSREQSSVSVSLYHTSLNGFCENGSVGRASKSSGDLFVEDLLPDTQVNNGLVQGFCHTGNLRKVRELLGFTLRKNFSISVSSYRSLMRLLCTKDSVNFALTVKELMLSLSNIPYHIIYNILIFHLFSTENYFLVDSLLDELHEMGLQPDETTYNFVIYGFSRCKAALRSVQFLNCMMSKELRPSNRSLRIVISYLCHDEKLGEALRLSKEMESKGWIHHSIIQNDIVESLISNGKLEDAVNFLDRIVGKGLVPGNIVYDNLIKRFCLHGRQDKATDLLNTMLGNGSQPLPTSYDYLIQVFCNCHKLSVALDLHAEMLNRDLKPSIKTWTSLINKFCECGQVVEAEALLSSMLQMGENPSRDIYCSMVNRFRFENNISKVSELLQAMQRSGHRPDFEAQWSLISNLSHPKDQKKGSQRFLSRLLSQSGFAQKKDPNAKPQ